MFKKLKLIILSFIYLASFGGVATMQAAELKVGKSLVIDKKFNDDVYFSAGEIVFKGQVNGDANLVAGELTLNADVSQDLNIISGSAAVTSNVSDDVHIVTGQGTISGKIKGDVFVTGGEFKILDGAVIYGDLYIAGGNVKVIGDVKGKVVVAGGNIVLAGNIGKSLKIRSGKADISAKVRGVTSISTRNLKLNSKAKFYGDINYWSKEEVDFSANLAKKNIKVTYDETLKKTYDTPWGLIVFFSIVFLLSVLLTIYVLLRYLGRRLEESSDYLQTNFLGSFGAGVLYFIGVPVILLLLFVTFVAWPFAMVLSYVYVLTFVFARPATSIMLAYYLQKRSGNTWSLKKLYFASFGLYLALAFIGFIPIIGWLFMIVLISGSVGSILQVARQGMQKKK